MQQSKDWTEDRVLRSIIAALEQFPFIKKAFLFGSRARGDHGRQSDYDIAVYPAAGSGDEALRLRQRLDDLDTLYKIDLVVVDQNTEPALIQNIEKEGVILVERDNKRVNYCRAVERLCDAIGEYASNPSDTMRDGVIQSFELTTELAWKACREYLSEMGYAEVNGPKPVMREAFAHGMIAEDAVWIDILNHRNLTSHVYREQTANEIFERIRTKYADRFKALARYFLENGQG